MHKSPGIDRANTTVILTQFLELDNLDKASCRFFDQYEKDIARGNDMGRYAEFYLEQLHVVRTTFWFNELSMSGPRENLRTPVET
jgi:hypothetical protein